MPMRPVRRRRVVMELVELARDGALASHGVVPPAHRVMPRARLTFAEEEIAVLVALTGNLHAVAFGTGRTVGSVKNVVNAIARKLPGSLPAMPRVAVWVRGGDALTLGTTTKRHIPEHLLRDGVVAEHAAMSAHGQVPPFA